MQNAETRRLDLVLSDKEYFLCAKRILKKYNYMSSKRLVRLVNEELGTAINSYTLGRFILIYNDGSVQKKGKASWEYVE